MASTPWKTDDYFVSSWNYQPEVTAGQAPPARIAVHDVTLRDGEQQAGVEFTADEKVRIAEALAEAGVDRIEIAGYEGTLAPIVDTTLDEFDEVLRSNIRGTWLSMKSLRAQTLFHTDDEVVASEELGLFTLDAIEAITINGANACWLGSRVGSLTVGKRADIVLLRELDPSVTSLGDIQAAVVASAHGSSVETVIVDGQIVKRDGALVGIDRGTIGGALARSRERLFAAAGYTVG